LCPAIPPPPRGGWVETRTFPRVPHRPLTSGRCFTRGYSPPPRWGEKRRLQSLPACGYSPPPRWGEERRLQSLPACGYHPPPRWGEERQLQSLPVCGLCVRSPALPLFSFSLRILHSALLTPVPRPSVPPSLSDFSCKFPPPLARKLCTTVYAHLSMSQTIKFVSKSIKKATFSVKKRSKTSAFRHAHLNILGCHPLWR